jgi:hypothetical protein
MSGLVRGDAIDLPFATGSFSAVVAFTMLHHIPTMALHTYCAIPADEAGARLASVGFEDVTIERQPRVFRFRARRPRTSRIAQAGPALYRRRIGDVTVGRTRGAGSCIGCVLDRACTSEAREGKRRALAYDVWRASDAMKRSRRSRVHMMAFQVKTHHG